MFVMSVAMKLLNTKNISIMKYPKEQFEKLVEYLTVISKYYDLGSITNFSYLHSFVYTNVADGQKHNKTIIKPCGGLGRSASLDSEGNLVFHEGTQILEDDFSFKLYPAGCNDDNIETAVRKAVKLILNKQA